MLGRDDRRRRDSQLSALSTSTTLVSITIGGNDENFAGIMEDCNLYSDDTCVSEIQAAEDDAQANLPGKLDALYGIIRADAPNARRRPRLPALLRPGQ